MSVGLTLPATSSPAMDPYKDLPDPLLPFALFVHAALGDEEEMANIEETSNSQSEGATPVRRAPHRDLAGRPLRGALPGRAPGPAHRDAPLRSLLLRQGGDEDGDTAV